MKFWVLFIGRVSAFSMARKMKYYFYFQVNEILLLIFSVLPLFSVEWDIYIYIHKHYTFLVLFKGLTSFSRASMR